MQTPISQLVTLASIYGSATGRTKGAISKRVFNDGKVIDNLIAGSDITLGRLERAMRWFSDNWPDGAEWPPDVERPQVSKAA